MKIVHIVLLSFLLFGLSMHSNAQVAVRGDIVYSMNGSYIENGVVLINGRTIERVGSSEDIEIPDHYTVYSGKVVTPGLIDARSVVGLAGMFNYNHDQDQLELSAPVQPELRAIDAYNPREDLVDFLMGFGVTTIHTGHAPGALASGQTMIVKTGGRYADAIIDSSKMVVFTLGPRVTSNFTSPGTRSKSIAMLRSDFLKAREYANRRSHSDPERRPSPDIKLETLARVLNRELTALFTVHTATEILAAFRLTDEFGFNLVLAGASEAYLVIDEIKAAGVPVIIHPTMIRAFGDARNASFETAAKLHEAGILVVFQSGYESYVPKTRIVHYEAAIAVANGLPFEQGLASVTIDSARLLGIDDRVGSLESGKDADLVVWDGDPFEYLTNVETVFINGQVLKQKE
jgi:imidazolonepropionase-like amidohydrolase